MSIITCPQCGKSISDKAPECIYCGYVLTKSETRICPECGAEIEPSLSRCPQCGCPIDIDDSTTRYSGNDLTVEEERNAVLRINKRKWIKTLSIFMVIVVIVVFIVIDRNQLKGDDLNAFGMVYMAAEYFKDPTSVRLVSGTFSESGWGRYLYCGISATNGFGARTTSYYLLYLDNGINIATEENPSSIYKATDQLNIVKINKKLEKTLRKY